MRMKSYNCIIPEVHRKKHNEICIEDNTKPILIQIITKKKKKTEEGLWRVDKGNYWNEVPGMDNMI